MVIVVIMDTVTFSMVFLVELFLIALMATVTTLYHTRLRSTRLEQQHVLQKTSTGRPGAVIPISDRRKMFLFFFESPIEECQIRTVVPHGYPPPRALCRRFSFQTHLDALRTLSAVVMGLKVGLPKSFHQGATETTFTTWTSCYYSSLTFLSRPGDWR